MGAPPAQKWMDWIKNNTTRCKTDAAAATAAATANRNELTPNRWEIICTT